MKQRAAIPQTLPPTPASNSSRLKLSKCLSPAFTPCSDLVSQLQTIQKNDASLTLKEQVERVKTFYFDKVVKLLKALQKRIVQCEADKKLLSYEFSEYARRNQKADLIR